MFSLLLLGDAVVRAGWLEMLLLAPWMLLVTWAVYVAVYASYIAIDDAGATVQNYLRRTTVAWGGVADITMQWQIVFALQDGTELKAFGGPVSGRPGRAAQRARDRSASKPVAFREFDIIREAWERASDRVASPAVRSWDVPALAALGVIVVWAIIAVIATRG